MMRLCILFAVAAANRVSELDRLDAVVEAGDSKPEEEAINLLLVPGPEFSAMERPVLSHQMEIKPGAADIAVDIQDTYSGKSDYGYQIELVGPNGQVEVGKLSSGVRAVTSHLINYEFKTTSGKSFARMQVHLVKIASGGPGRTAYVTSAAKRKPYTYYTFTKDRGAGQYRGGNRLYVGWQTAGEVVFSVFKGRVPPPGKGWPDTTPTPYLQAKGQYGGWKFQFFLAGQAEPVAVMDKQQLRYRLEIKSGIDPIMLSMLVGFIDSCSKTSWNDDGVRLTPKGRKRLGLEPQTLFVPPGFVAHLPPTLAGM